MQGGKTEESNMKNSRGQKLLDTFRVLSGVHFMHTICRFEAWEVRSPMLQTVHELELKQRSYGHLKITASSYGKISQLRNQLRNQPLAVKWRLSACEILQPILHACEIHLSASRYLRPTLLDFFLQIFVV